VPTISTLKEPCAVATAATTQSVQTLSLANGADCRLLNVSRNNTRSCPPTYARPVPGLSGSTKSMLVAWITAAMNHAVAVGAQHRKVFRNVVGHSDALLQRADRPTSSALSIAGFRTNLRCRLNRLCSLKSSIWIGTLLQPRATNGECSPWLTVALAARASDVRLGSEADVTLRLGQRLLCPRNRTLPGPPVFVRFVPEADINMAMADAALGQLAAPSTIAMSTKVTSIDVIEEYEAVI
jgi:hypothetical protein